MVVATVVLLWVSSAPGAEGPYLESCPLGTPQSCQQAGLRLAEAEAAIESAARLRALWTTAQHAFTEAKTLFKTGDYEGAERAAAIAIEQAKRGIAQTRYPSLPIPKP